MRVAFDVTPLVGVRTGIGQAVAEIYEQLSQPAGGTTLVPYALSLRARQHRATLPPDTRFLPIPARLLLRTWGRSEWPRVDRWLRDVDLVHATNYLSPPSHLPTVVSVYDCSFIRFPDLSTPETRAFTPMLRRALRRGAWVHTGSEFSATEIKDVFAADLASPDHVVVVPLGVPKLGTVTPNASVTGRYVLALGRLEPRKNLDRLVRAFAKLGAAPDVRLIIAGPDGPARLSIDTARAALPPDVAERVEVRGAVSDEERLALLAGAAVLAYPSTYEGFGFPILEAMSVGTPVVAGRAGSIPEIAGDAAVLVDPADTDALARAIAEVLDDPARHRELVDRGHLRAAQFTWDSTAAGLRALYARVASAS